MNTKLLEFALEGLQKEIEKLKLEMKELKDKVTNSNQITPPVIIQTEDESELLDTNEVLKKLGICYNTLQTIIKKGLITPIRVSKRRIRFSKKSIKSYILSLSN